MLCPGAVDDRPIAIAIWQPVSRMKHHPALADIACWQGELPAGFDHDFVGSITRRQFVEGLVQGSAPAEARHVQTTLPPFDEEYFEWVDLFEAIRSARDKFVMIELGAGYGRWMVRAVKALERFNPMPYQLVAVEAEPTHFAWLKQHLSDNGIDPVRCELYQAAVDAKGEPVKFHVGNPSGWYGQAISRGPRPGQLQRLLFNVHALLFLGKQPNRSDKVKTTWVRAITLERILERLGRVDLIDLDVQGAELEVLAAAIDRLDLQVKRLHIGTHSPEVEQELRALLKSHRWELIRDYACLSPNKTPYGEIEFGDGVQSWINPRL